MQWTEASIPEMEVRTPRLWSEICVYLDVWLTVHYGIALGLNLLFCNLKFFSLQGPTESMAWSQPLHDLSPEVLFSPKNDKKGVRVRVSKGKDKWTWDNNPSQLIQNGVQNPGKEISAHSFILNLSHPGMQTGRLNASLSLCHELA